jgi:hypothetical protein
MVPAGSRKKVDFLSNKTLTLALACFIVNFTATQERRMQIFHSLESMTFAQLTGAAAELSDEHEWLRRMLEEVGAITDEVPAEVQNAWVDYGNAIEDLMSDLSGAIFEVNQERDRRPEAK